MSIFDHQIAEFQGEIGSTIETSRGWWARPRERGSRPNVLVVVLDDVGYAQLGSYGSDIETPTLDALAARGLRYSNFHTTALCSPTRACVLTGRNHHTNAMARVVEVASGFPGYNSHVPRRNGFISEILRDEGYATFCVGKWHLTPATELSAGSPRNRWPLARGFERYYGFLGGETDQYFPEVVRDNQHVERPATPEEGYHLTEDLVDNAMQYLTDLRGVSVDRPFFMWFAPGACHAPHQAPADYLERYRGRFDEGWDAWRERIFAKQVSTGIVKEGTVLTERPDWVEPWSSLSEDERRFAARCMEAFAAYLTHTDDQLARLLDQIERLSETDNTIVIVLSDNGASAEGSPIGLFNELFSFNFIPESLEQNVSRIDDIGTPRANNHYPWGWAWAGNTPLRRFKRDTHEGGITDPLIICWPKGIGTHGEIRRQYVHAIDIMPTLLDVLGIEPPESIDGVVQSDIEGFSFANSLHDADATSLHRVQYYEMLGSRGIYADGWKAVTFHPPRVLAYDGTDTQHPFDEDQWELYNVAEDFSESNDLARQEPERLRNLVELWWNEAKRFQVLPLNNQPAIYGDPRVVRDEATFIGRAGPLAEGVAPHLKNRSFRIEADLHGSGGIPDGIIVAHGGHAAGLSFYVHEGRLGFTYNFVGAVVTTVTAREVLPDRDTTVSVVFEREGHGGRVTLTVDGEEVGRGTVDVTVPLTFGPPGFCVGFQSAGPIDPRIVGRAEFPIDVLGRVQVTAWGTDPIRAHMLDPRADLATQ